MVWSDFPDIPSPEWLASRYLYVRRHGFGVPTPDDTDWQGSGLWLYDCRNPTVTSTPTSTTPSQVPPRPTPRN